jgi:hypothetical protein
MRWAVAAPDLETLAAYHRFVAGPSSAGGWVEVGSDVTADDSLRKDVEVMVRNLFNEVAGGPPPGFEPKQTRPLRTRKGDKVQFAIAIVLSVGPMIRADATLIVEGDVRILEEDVPPRWRIADLKLVSAQKRTPPGQGAPPQRR